MNVAIIDDSKEVLAIMKICMTDINVNPICFKDPRIALVEIPKINPDVIISDFMMFDIDGMDLLKQLKELGLTSTMVLYTSMNDPELEEECHKNNIIFVRKDSNCKEIKDVVKGANNVSNITI